MAPESNLEWCNYHWGFLGKFPSPPVRWSVFYLGGVDTCPRDQEWRFHWLSHYVRPTIVANSHEGGHLPALPVTFLSSYKKDALYTLSDEINSQ